MACRWRIRHKLMLGLALVVCILAVVLLGTLRGLASYRATLTIVDSKLVELHEAQSLKVAMTDLAVLPDPGPGEIASIQAKIKRARSGLKSYQTRLDDMRSRNPDSAAGDQSRDYLKDFDRGFDQLEVAIKKATEDQAVVMEGTPTLRNNPGVREAILDLGRTCDELQEVIYQGLYDRLTQAKEDYHTSLTVVVATSVLGVLLMAGLLRFFYRWTLAPLRDLQAGVARVGDGDFDQPIQVRSGDEMEELAAAFNDMTGRLGAMYRDLEQQVNERSRQLVRSERLASLGFLAAGVAHEINNPLASIAFCSEALEKRIAALEPRRPVQPPQLRLVTEAETEGREDWQVVARYLKMIQEEAFRCKAITQRLLEFSRGGERRREPTDLAGLVQSVIDMVQHLESSKGKQIVFQPLPTGLTASVNAQEIKSVVLNLVVNALESMEEGGRLSITLALRDRQAEMIFTDTGCGMTAEVLENIFEPFFTRSRTGKGTGLGLSISHRVINQHGGEIEATSAGPDQGSTFMVRLPLRPAETASESLGNSAA